METFEESIEVHAPVEFCYHCWHEFSSFPALMHNVKKVSQIGENIWQWVLVGPQGDESEWELMLVRDIPNQQICWQTVRGPEMEISLDIDFMPVHADLTRILIKVRLASPENPIGHLLKGLFGISEREIRQNLETFRDVMETMLEECQSSKYRGSPANLRDSQESLQGRIER